MDGDSTSLAYAELQPQDFLDALERLGFDCNGRLLALNSYENRVYQVGIGDDDAIVAKFYRPNRWSDAAILEEHGLPWNWPSRKFLSSRRYRSMAATLHAAGDFRVAIYPRRGGRAPELDDLDLLEQLGRFVARIHLVGETAEFEHRPGIDVQSYAIDSRDYLLRQRFIPDELLPAYSSVADQVIDSVERP